MASDEAAPMEQRLTRPLAPFSDPVETPETPHMPGPVLPLTKEEMDSISQREFGPRLLTLIQQKRWPDLPRERSGCGFLAKHCFFCGQYIGRAQAMHHHVRAYHRAFSPLVQAKATQLTNLHCRETPCLACGVTFLSSHSCNVWFQVAMIIVHGPKQSSVRLELKPAHLSCEICDATCETSQALHEHLQRDHHLVSSVWHESRDSFLGQPVCNHCHALFQSLEGLRSHINQGRCKQFNPELTTAPSAVDAILKDACCRGMFDEVLQDARHRQRLTLRCQCCPKHYSRAADLAAHLQSCHPDIWAAAQPLVYPVSQKYLESQGCVCNPQCNVVRLQHICLPLLQMMMQLTRIPDAIFMPAKLTTTELARTLPHHVPADLRCTLEQALMRYDLRVIWTDVLMMDALSGTCFQCGCDLLPAELCYHLHEVDGMRSALLHATATLCVHIDRCVMGPDLNVHKCNCKLQIEEECFFPVFQNDSITSVNHAYTTVAIMAHLGDDRAGHYRSALRIKPLILNRTQPIQWLITDDWTPPQATWNLPCWLQENVTMVWLVRSDLLRLPLYQASQDRAASSTAELLQLLSETPNTKP